MLEDLRIFKGGGIKNNFIESSGATRYNTIQYVAIHCITLPYNTLHYHPIPYDTIQYVAMHCHTLPYITHNAPSRPIHRLSTPLSTYISRAQVVHRLSTGQFTGLPPGLSTDLYTGLETSQTALRRAARQ